ncbi:MAG: hypothetical protein GQ550_00520 [Gammaproteobacteria bacterium]|nr:hypothetical protein [Gammaproteobacteria bacterium]
MTTLYDIAKFCDAFEEQISAINHLKPESVPEKDINHIQLYKKSLVMSAIDTLAGLRFTKENYKALNLQNKKRFVRFIAEFAEWENGPFISVPYLFDQLARRDLKESDLYDYLYDRIEKHEEDGEGSCLHIEDVDVLAVELFELAKTEYEEQLILKSQHYSLFYEYKNCKTNTLSESGGVMETFQYAHPNYYSGKRSAHHGLIQWQLSYPLAHFNALFSSGLKNMRQYFIKADINPYLLVDDS